LNRCPILGSNWFRTTVRLCSLWSSCLILESKWFCTTGRLVSFWSSCLILGSNWFWSSCLILGNNWPWSICLILGSNWPWSSCLILGSNWFWSSCLVLGSNWSSSTRASGRLRFFLLLLIADMLGVQQSMHSMPVASKLISLYPIESHLYAAAEQLSTVCTAKTFCLLFSKQTLPSSFTYSQTGWLLIRQA